MQVSPAGHGLSLHSLISIQPPPAVRPSPEYPVMQVHVTLTASIRSHVATSAQPPLATRHGSATQIGLLALEPSNESKNPSSHIHLKSSTTAGNVAEWKTVSSASKHVESAGQVHSVHPPRPLPYLPNAAQSQINPAAYESVSAK